MTSAQHRLFVLLGAYEDLTDRETSALRRGDIDYVLAIQERKSRLTDSLERARRATELPDQDTASLADRVHSLQARETANLSVLREQMEQVRQTLHDIGQVAQRSRKVRRGYTVLGASMRVAGESVLGRA